jgi:hypothetical protein
MVERGRKGKEYPVTVAKRPESLASLEGRWECQCLREGEKRCNVAVRHQSHGGTLGAVIVGGQEREEGVTGRETEITTRLLASRSTGPPRPLADTRRTGGRISSPECCQLSCFSLYEWWLGFEMREKEEGDAFIARVF